MGNTSTLSRLVKISSGLCHYCQSKTNRQVGHPRQATKEHVVPKAFGGRNGIANYVLACATCNNERGTALFFCECDFCSTLIHKALDNRVFVDNIFNGIIKHNRVKVYAFEGKWAARRGHNRRVFKTWTEAMNYAEHGQFEKGK